MAKITIEELYRGEKYDIMSAVTVPPQRKSIKDYHRTTCEQSKYLAK